MNKKEIRKMISSIELIPVAAARTISLLGDSNAEVKELSSIIESDPGLAINILKKVNSASFGLQGMISSVREAIVRLGFKKIREICILLSCSKKLAQPVKAYDLPPMWLWSHLMATAFAAEELENRLNSGKCKTDVFTAGLFHDIGKIALGTFCNIDPRKISKLALEKKLTFVQAEREVLGTDHAEVGALMLEQWSIPENIVAVTRHHHDCENSSSPYQDGIDIIHIADIIAMMTGIGNGVDGLNYRVSAGAEGRIGIGVSDCEQLLVKTMERLNKWHNLLAGEFFGRNRRENGS